MHLTALMAVIATVAAACGGRQANLCGGTDCGSHARCADVEGVEKCECVEGYIMRAGRCRPEGPCGRLAAAICNAVGNDPDACGALRRGVTAADGAACERRLAAGALADDVAWLGEVQPALARDTSASYADVLARSLLDPCGAAAHILCSLLRSGDRSCGRDDASIPSDDRACRSMIRNFERSQAGTPAEGTPGTGGEQGGVAGRGVMVRLVPDPASPGRMAGGDFRAGLLAARNEIEACYSGAAEHYPGLAGRAVFRVAVSPDGSVRADVGRADGPISGSGVAECVRSVLAGLDFSSAPPTGGEASVHVALDFGTR